MLACALACSQLAHRARAESPAPAGGSKPVPTAAAGGCERLVSLAPSLTEAIFALGLEDRLRGVTRYDSYPPEARKIPRIGGFVDPSYEAILMARPSALFMLDDSAAHLEPLRRLGLRAEVFSHRSIAGILESVERIGIECGRPQRGEELADSLRARLRAISLRLGGTAPRRALVAIGNAREAGNLRSYYLSGNDGFYNDILEHAGGTNVLDRPTVSLPNLSIESLLVLAPEVILAVIPKDEQAPLDMQRAMEAWRGVPGLKAAQSGNIHFLEDDFFFIPGPRFIEAVEKFSLLLHPPA